MIILGVDPGLTRCGRHDRSRRAPPAFVYSRGRGAVLTDITQDLRLLAIYNGLSEKMDRFAPDAVSIERVFAQSNRNTVLGTAQAAGLAMLAAAQRNIPVALHTPTEAKLAITGNGQARRFGGAYGDTYFEPHQNADSRRCRRCLGFGHLPCAAPGRRIAGRRTRTTSDRRATPVG